MCDPKVQKFVHQKRPNSIFPFVNFSSSHQEPWVRGAMKQRILSYQTPRCHRRPVTAHECSAALQHRGSQGVGGGEGAELLGKTLGKSRAGNGLPHCACAVPCVGGAAQKVRCGPTTELQLPLPSHSLHRLIGQTLVSGVHQWFTPRSPLIRGGGLPCGAPRRFRDVYSPASGHGFVGVAFLRCLVLRACAATRGRTSALQRAPFGDSVGSLNTWGGSLAPRVHRRTCWTKP